MYLLNAVQRLHMKLPKKIKILSYLYEVALVVYAQNYVDVLLRQWNYIERAEEFTRPHNDFPFIFLSIFLRLLGVLLAVCAVLCCRRDAS